MIEVWGRKNSFNVQKVLWCCEELGVAVQRHDAGGLFGVTDEAGYLARNPTGLVPTISDNGFEIWESNTIVRYLSAEYGPGVLWPENAGERALADKWMDYQLGTLWPAFKDTVLGLVRTPAERRDPEKITASVKGTAQVLGVLESHLEDHEYVASSTLSMGDVALGSTIYRWLNLDVDRPSMPNLQAWHARLEDRAAYQRTVMVSFEKENPDQPED